MTLALSFGKWGGFYILRGHTFRVCLGWVALTYFPEDIDVILSANGGETMKAKERITQILMDVTQRDEKYWYDCTYLRWGKVEKDLHAVIDELTPHKGD